MTQETPNRRVVKRIGRVKSDKMAKSIVVRVERKVMHPVYGKYVKRYTSLTAHDEQNQARVGDLVEIEFMRPLSKTKRWRLTQVLEVMPVTDPIIEAEVNATKTKSPKAKAGGAA
jgi:small subunit ribosomal protein S17